MAAHLHLFQCRILNRLQGFYTPGRAGNTSKKARAYKTDSVGSILVVDFDPIGNTSATDEDGRHAFTAYPDSKPSSRCTARGRLRPPSSRSRTHSDAARTGTLRVWRPFGPLVFPDHQHRLV